MHFFHIWLSRALAGIIILSAYICVPTVYAVNVEASTQTLPARYNEAPMLAEQVAAGTLPPVGERLPDNPAVIAPIENIGKYGGTWRKLGAGVNDIQLSFRLGYEPLVRWGRDGQTVEPGIAESCEMRDGGRTFVFHLRKGMRWSDGHPFTSEDFKYTFDNQVNYDGFGNLALPWFRANNELPKIETPDPLTVIYRFPIPYGNFLRGVAAAGLQHDMFGPSHYLKKYHEKFADPKKLKQQIAAAGFVTWVDFYTQRIDPNRNVDLPVVAAWQVKIPFPASQCVAVRNPYYWKVDTDGNQLPYIDSMVTNIVFDSTILNLKALNGEADFQMRGIDASNFTLFKEKGQQVGYRTLYTPSTNPTCVYINQFSRNNDLREILQDRRFRLALSHAINRQELIDLVYSGIATSSSAVSAPEDPYFIPGMDTANIKYDPELSNRLLDEIGLKRRESDGMRVLPDGTPFRQILHIYQSEEGSSADLWQLVVDYWRDVGLQFAAKQEDATLSFLQVTSGNSDFWAYASSSLHWAVDGLWKVPISSMSYMAPLYGNYYHTNGKQGIKPSPEIQRLIDWYEAMRATPDEEERLKYGRLILKQWAEECYVIGICQPPVVAIVSNRLRNVPDVINYDYRIKSPGHLNVEQFYIDDDMAGPTK